MCPCACRAGTGAASARPTGCDRRSRQQTRCNTPAASASDRLVDQLSSRIGGLGVELADVAGNVQEVAQRVANQSERFGDLQKTAETMVSANHGIAHASRAVQGAASAAVDEITQSRATV